jgi:SPX domain protein involved in polyphosphate accumulation
MKFGKYLEKQAKEEWRSFYLDYKGLKDLIKESAKEAETAGPTAFSPRTTSLSIVRAAKTADAAEERFFQKLEAEVRQHCVLHVLLCVIGCVCLLSAL